MTIEQEFTELLEQSQDKKIIGFLQRLNNEEKKALVPLVKKLATEYSVVEKRGDSWATKANVIQGDILHYASFVCFTKKDFEKENPAWMMSRKNLDKFLDWYHPSWLSDYINSFINKEWISVLKYDYLIELKNRGFITPAPELIAKVLVAAIFDDSGKKTLFTPEILLKYPETLEEHIWYLFEYETNVYNANRWIHLEQKEEKNWETVFTTFVKEGRIDKQKILKESLLAAHRNFHKNLSGWFADLFWQLSPNENEIISLQPEIFNLFSSPHSKVAGAALQACKTICDNKKFSVTSFLDHVPVLLASDTKQNVVATLQLLEKIAKDRQEYRMQIVHLAAGVFVHRDESLQTRAAKLIGKWADAADEKLKQTLILYHSNIFSGAQTLLGSFLCTEDKVEATSSTHVANNVVKKSLNHAMALPLVHNIDELVFLAAQAFDNNESWHIDLLPDALLRLNNQIKGEHLVQLEPAIQRALKLYFGDLRITQGALDKLLACFFLDYALWLIGQFPEQTTSTKKLFKTFFNKSEGNKKIWEEHGINVTFFNGWKSYGDEIIYRPHQKLLASVLAALKSRRELPLLSTPTHAPAYIDSLILMERLCLYQASHAMPDDTDVQIAMSRCWRHDPEKAIAAAEKKLTGEWKALMLFLLDKEAAPTGIITHGSGWMMAALTKAPEKIFPGLNKLSYSNKPRAVYTGQYPWKIIEETFETTGYNWVNGKSVSAQVFSSRKIIRVDLSTQKELTPDKLSENGTNKKSGAQSTDHLGPAPLIFEYFQFKGTWFTVEDRDIRRLYFLAPFHPEPILAMTLNKCLSLEGFGGETEKRFVTEVLKALQETGMPSGEMAHLFLATCMISSDKTMTRYAAEIWIDGVNQNKINNKLIGSMLAQQQQIGFAPLKRFTDCILENIFGISSEHNQQLEILITSMLGQLPPEPVKGLKKLLEIYLETLRLNASTIHDEQAKKMFNIWSTKDGLSKLIKTV